MNSWVRGVLALSFAAFASTATAKADSVQITHDGLTLNGNLTLADGKTLKDGVVLFLHGTLAHNGMEIVTSQQELLAERELNSLAVTLSMGVSDRKGMYDCAVPHTHRHEDALDEIDVWVDWLKKQGAPAIDVVGHSRGGAQMAWYMAERDDPAIKTVVLVAPGQWNADKAAKGFKKTHKADLSKVLADAKALVDAGKGDQMMKGVGILYCPGADVSAKSIVSYYGDDARRDTPSLLKKLKKPSLVVVGTNDDVAAGLVDRVQPLADAGVTTLIEVDEAGHFFRDLIGDDLADAIAEFVAPGNS